MANVRLIARLDIKGPNLIKGINLEGVRVVGDPQAAARQYYEGGIDELIYMDAVASLYGRNNLVEFVKQVTKFVFVPSTVGGGVRSVEDVYALLRAGADKVAINTAALKRPQLLQEVSQRFGSQCLVLSIEAKRQQPGKWEAYMDSGREKTGVDAVEWARQGVELGAGEILITSIDQEGTKLGFDTELTRAISNAVTVPVIASGGMGKVSHFVDVVRQGGADAVAMASVLHYKRLALSQIRSELLEAKIPVRIS